MDRSGRNRNQLPNNLPQLQNLIKRDKDSYRDEFLQQYRHYEALLQLFLLNPAQESEQLKNLVMFLSQICNCYAEELKGFPGELMSLLRQHGPVLEPEVRMTLCRGLILMRNKDFLEPQSVLELFFELFQCQDKILRKALFTHIVSDVKRINLKRRNNKVNLALQNMMYGVFRQSSATTSRMALNVMTELYKKNIWKDAKTVNVVATACFSSITKICVAALQFFLTGEEEKEEEGEESSSDEEVEGHMMRTYLVAKQASKKGRKRDRKMKRALASIKKKSKQKKKRPQQEVVFSALHLLNDPQDFAEKLFHKLERSKDKFEVRLMMMSLISRLVGLHQLILFNFYPYLQRYLQPHQRDVTKVLTFLAQAAHKLVPPEVLEAPLRAVVNNFVTERNSSEVMAVGLNAVREVCVRCPLVMEEDLLRDLTEYRSYRDKSVMMAARSLIHLYRELDPRMLRKKDRGRPTEASMGGTKKVSEFGALETAEMVPGAELIDLSVLDPPAAITADCGLEEREVARDTARKRVEGNADEDDDGEDAEEKDEDIVEDDVEELVGKEGEENGDEDEQEEPADEKSEEGSDQEEGSVDNQSSASAADGGGAEGGKASLEELRQRRREAAALVGVTRFLTQEEFEKIRVEQLNAAIAPSRGRKRQLEEMLREQEERRQEAGELLSEAAINVVPHAKRKRSKEERVASIKEGREGREKFGSKRKKLNPHSSTTNRQKAKKKAFTMVRHKRSIRGKNKKSFREKQISLRNSLLKQKRRK